MAGVTCTGHLVVSPLCEFHKVISTHRGSPAGPAVPYFRDIPPTWRWRLYLGEAMVTQGIAPSLETAKASATIWSKKLGAGVRAAAQPSLWP